MVQPTWNLVWLYSWGRVRDYAPFLFGLPWHFSADTGWVMTFAFLVLGPAVVGFISVSEAEAKDRTSAVMWIFSPWIPTLFACGLAILFKLEGAICLVFAIPITLVGASLGGIAAGLVTRSRDPASRSTLVCVACIPFVFGPAEVLLVAPVQTRTVQSAILIHAPAPVVWQNIERVPPIAPSELQTTWAQRIGFPRPIEATLSHEGVGGVRHARFERGLGFFETVTAWSPGDRLAFSIRADTTHIPPTTLDEHVKIGGRYFDVLDGEYRLEPQRDGSVMLHLTSHQRLSTDFNGYAGLWSDEVMQSLQTSILTVIRHRCEQQPVSLTQLRQ